MSRPRRASMTMSTIGAIVFMAASLAACSHSSSRNPYAEQGELIRDTQRARELHAQASRLPPDDRAGRELLLREALTADLYFGPAHNNLGVLLLDRGELYDAAAEFEWARKLMPGHPDPRVNLALVLERAGKTEEALSAYDAALAAYDNYLPALQGRARLQIATGRTDNATLDALDEITLRGDAAWREWARLWRIKLSEGN